MKSVLKILHPILIITRKELSRIFSDGGVMLLFFGATIVYPLIYGICYFPEVLRNVPIAVIDLDKSPDSRHLKNLIDATPEITLAMDLASMEEARRAFFEGKINGIVLIPEDFSKSLGKKEQTAVVTYSDASYMLYYKQIMSGVTAAIQQFNNDIKVLNNTKAGIHISVASAMANPVRYVSEPLYNSSSGYGSYAMPALLILILQQSMLIGIGMLSGSERELGLRSYIHDLSLFKGKVSLLILGKVAAYLIIYVPISLFMLYVIPSWFKFPFVSGPLTVLKFTVPFLFSVALLGLMLSTLFRSREQSIITLVFTSIPIIFLSGFSWPVEAFPRGFRTLAYLFPSSHAIPGYLKLAVMGTPFSTTASNWTWLWVLAAVYGITTWLILRGYYQRISRR